MKYIDEFRDPAAARALVRRIERSAQKIRRPVRIMEICGSHTVAIFRSGIKSLLPENIRLVSGPGCPVCVTGMDDMDRMIFLAQKSLENNIILATFGDMLRVPGSSTSLERVKAAGGEVRIAATPLDALRWASENRTKHVVFLGVGFETTSPAIAACILRARKEGLSNFSIYPAFKLLPPAMNALLENRDVNLDGFLCPGHVSVLIGAGAYTPFSTRYRKPCVISGFEPLDILHGISTICDLLANNIHEVRNVYGRAVTGSGNVRAMEILNRVFEPVGARWRGLGEIPGSGLTPTEEFSSYNALSRFDFGSVETGRDPEGCACGEVLKGILDPPGCPLFGKACTPDSPVGSCMVSSEGSCAAWFRYAT